MKKVILFGLIALVVIVAVFAFIKTRPSGDINDYSKYYADSTQQGSDSSLRVTFFGVSTLLFDDGQTQILLDAYFSRPSMSRMLLTSMESETALIDELLAAHRMNMVKGIFVKHSHIDHVFDVAYVARKTNATLHGSVSTLNVVKFRILQGTRTMTLFE